MTTIDDPKADAAELSKAATRLADTSAGFEQPIDSYTVLAHLQSTMMTLHQTLQQIAAFHIRLVDRASTDTGDHGAGREHALIAAMRLEEAAIHVDRATNHLTVAFVENGQIAWQPTPTHAATSSEILAERADTLEIDPIPAQRSPEPPTAGH